MPTSTLSRVVSRQAPLKRATLFQQPDNCPVIRCSAIIVYEQEMARHRANELKLRETISRESALLREKEELIQQMDILGKESEHRLLNGLQLITSLLSVQSRGTKNTEAATQLTIAASRVATLARIHQHLHTPDKAESVEFKQFLEKLCRDVSDMASNEFPERSISVEAAELKIPSATAIPLGFIASELITNSIKYANGKITVGLQTRPTGGYALSVSDDGPGLPASFDPTAMQGQGMKIIATLVRQIRGELHFTKGRHDQGTQFSVTF